MASRASSKGPASGPPAQIPALPGLGTTWYKRGPRYWLRRTLTGILWLALLAFLCGFALRMYSGVPRSDLPPTARTVWDGIQVVGSCVAVPWGWVRQRRDHHRKLLDPPTPGQTREAKRAHDRRAPTLARAGVIPLLIAAPVLPVLTAWAVGWFVAYLTVREYPSEVGARRALQKAGGPSS